MDQLTLTGATLVSSKKNDDQKDWSGLELTKATASSHSHNHNHGACCGPRPAPQVRVVYTPPSDEELMNAPPEEIRTSLCTLIRLGGYEDAFVPMLDLVLEKRPSAQTEVLDALGEDHYSLLHWATKRADDVRFLQLLCTKVNPKVINMQSSDAVAMRPLHWAATEGCLPHAATLLKYGAALDGTDGAGCTPLLIAAQYGHVDLVAFLLQRGANGKAVDKNLDSALHWAAYKGSIHVCGHLLYRNELNWTTQDSYGQTPLHLASLRGHTAVVRYLLQEGTPHEARKLLALPDKNGKTPLDLAITKKKPTVELVLREQMDKLYGDRTKQIRSALRQFCSYHSWQLWMGCGTGDDIDVAPKFPLYFMWSHMLMYSLCYPLVFTPIFNTSSGILWDYMGFHFVNLLACLLMWYCHHMTRITNPGTLDQRHPETSKYRRLYEQTIESFAEMEQADREKMQLCHTCHIARPLRSKHCRDMRRCVLLFDHHCPFVGNTVGLYNYKWFYLTLFFTTYCCISFTITMSIYLHRRFSWSFCLFGIYLSLVVLFSGGMLIYHTQLMLVNLTTNEHINVSRYKYLQSERGAYSNPFFKGWLNNAVDRFFPSISSYTFPSQHEPLLADAV